jgi:hypothetical protein
MSEADSRDKTERGTYDHAAALHCGLTVELSGARAGV